MTKQAERIRALNDELRTTGIGGRVVLTNGISALTSIPLGEVLRAVQSFADFTPDNDPHGEHDCAVLTAAGHTVIFKIDYYDRSMTHGSADPADPGQTCRVLTIMLACEY